MKPCVVSSLPYSFPTGSQSYSVFASKIFGVPLLVPRWDKEKLKFWSVEPLSVTEEIQGGYTLLCSSFDNIYFKDEPSRIDWINSFPRPLIVVVHDGMDLGQHQELFWNGVKPDGYLTSMDSLAKMIYKFDKDTPCVVAPLPFISGENHSQALRFNLKSDAIITIGRILPEKGHRLVTGLCQMGYKVTVAGQKVEHYEYGLYYDKLVNDGANMIPNPEIGEIAKIASAHKIYMNMGICPEQELPVEYSDLEAIDVGCIPIVASWNRHCYKQQGFAFDSVESFPEAIPYINELFDNPELVRKMAKHNYGILNDIPRKYMEAVNKILGMVVK